MSVTQQLARRAAYTEMQQDDLYDSLMGKSADEVIGYINVMTDFEPYDIVKMAFPSLAENDNTLRAMFAVFNATCYDTSDEAEAAKAAQTVFTTCNDMTIEEAAAYVDDVDYMVILNNEAHCFDMDEETWWDQFLDIVGDQFTMDEAAQLVQLVFADQQRRSEFVDQLVAELAEQC